MGKEGKGWTIAKYLLTHEREMIADFGSASESYLGAWAVKQIGVDTRGHLRNSILRQNIAQYELDTEAFAATMARVHDETKAGSGPGASSSMLKYYGTELNKRRNELNLAVGGESALGWEGAVYQNGELCRDWLGSKANSIEGGTSEVQLTLSPNASSAFRANRSKKKG